MKLFIYIMRLYHISVGHNLKILTNIKKVTKKNKFKNSLNNYISEKKDIIKITYLAG